MASAQAKLAAAKAPRWMRFDLAVGNRLLEQKKAAYQYLQELIDSGGLPDPVLGWADPGLDSFRSDDEFTTVQAQIDKKNSETRSEILQIEASASQMQIAASK